EPPMMPDGEKQRSAMHEQARIAGIAEIVRRRDRAAVHEPLPDLASAGVLEDHVRFAIAIIVADRGDVPGCAWIADIVRGCDRRPVHLVFPDLAGRTVLQNYVGPAIPIEI